MAILDSRSTVKPPDTIAEVSSGIAAVSSASIIDRCESGAERCGDVSVVSKCSDIARVRSE
jgi:hypothetical protein